MLATPSARPWAGMRFHIPKLPEFISSHTVNRRVLERGGIVVDPDAEADVVVLPEPKSGDRFIDRSPATRWNKKGAVVMWEGAFIRALQLATRT